MRTGEKSMKPVPVQGMEVFRAQSSTERDATKASYLNFQKERNGSIDFRGRSLSKREAFFHFIDTNPVKWRGEFDRAAFFRYLDEKPDLSLDPKILWLLLAAKSNIAERYAVDLKLRTKGYENDLPEQILYLVLEEHYHTRILLDACRVFGLEFEMRNPRGLNKAFVNLAVRLPDGAHLPVVLCGEIFGSIAFKILWETADVFSAQPDVMERLRSLSREIMIDELGHVSFARSRLGALGLTIARKMYPHVVDAYLREMPELIALGGGEDKVRNRFLSIDLATSPEIVGMQFAA
jgi:hypothetical protein